jgi:pantoate--beta-alanine ligase
MGALHDGHMSLVAAAAEHSDFCVVSIFVNPTQFGPNEDLDRYPRTLDADRVRCEDEGVAAVFAPNANAMYPTGEETRVDVGDTTNHLCGANRPGHFQGVATIVTKLFAIVGPCIAVFGRKDYQQWRVVNRLVTDLLLPVQLVGAPILREADGLALSSRNRYLSDEARQRARALSQGLSRAVELFDAGERDVDTLRRAARDIIEPAVDRIDYVDVMSAEDVTPLSGQIPQTALLAVAAQLGQTRLIDNVVLGEDPAPLKA